MKSVLLVGYLGFNNFGDDLLCQQMIYFLQNQPQIKKIFVWGEDTLSVEGVQFIARKDFMHFIKMLFQIDGVLFLGGGLWQTQSGKGLSLWFYLLFAKFFIFIGKKIILFNQGVDAVTHPWTKASLKSLFNQSALSVVRETSHYSAFNYLNFSQMPDAAFLTPLTVHAKKGTLGLCLNGHSKIAWENLLMSVKLLSGLKKIYIFNFFPNQDGVLCQEIFKVLSPSHQVEIIEKDQILEKISLCEKMIASRYHALVLAMNAGAAAIGVSSSTKVVRLCQIYNQTHLNLDLKPKELAKLIQDSRPVSEAQILESKNRAAQAFAMLASHLK